MSYGGNLTNPIIDILFRTGNSTGDIAALRAEVAKLQGDMATTVTTGRAAGQSIGEIAAAVAPTAREVERLTALMDSYNRTVNGALIRDAPAAARGILELSRGLEDIATGGWLGGLNNVPGIIRSIGQNAGLSATEVNTLTAAVSLVGTAAFVLYQNWSKLEEYFQVGIARPAIEGIAGLKDELKKATHEVQELEKQTRLSLVEMGQYDKAKQKVAELTAELQRQKDLQDLMAGKSKAQRERASAFGEAVSESKDGGDPMAELVEALRTKMDAKGLVLNPATGREATPQRAAEDLMRDAAEGDKSARDAIVRTIQDVFGDKGSFAKNIIAAAPERKVAEKQRAEDLDAEEKALKALHDQAHKDDTAKAKELRARISDASEDDQITPDQKRAVIAAVRAELAGAKLEPDHAKGVEEAASDLERKLRVAAERAGKALEKGLDAMDRAADKAADKALDAGLRAGEKGVRKDQHEQDREAKAIAPGYRDRIEQELLRNQFLIQAGSPVARSAAEFNTMQARGLNPAVEPKLKQQAIEAQVGQQLRAGGEDPRLANELVRDARTDLDHKLATAFGKNVDTMGQFGATNAALMQTMAELTGRLGQLDAQNAATQFGLREVRGQLRRGAQMGPALGRRGN